MRLWLLAFALVGLYWDYTAASVIGIDYGTDWFKVSIVKPGIPLDVVLNRESKRKTNSLVVIREGERKYGSDAAALATRFPKQSYPSLKALLGQLYDESVAAAYRDTYASTMVKDEARSTCSFMYDSNNTFTVEELVAFQLAHAKEQAEIFGEEPVSSAVITVPPYFNQYERQAILDAATLAGLRVSSLVNDETAVAINYAMARNFETEQYHIFYDMGAGSTVVSLVKFFNTTVKKSPKPAPVLEVMAVGYDESLGGNAVDLKLQQLLSQEFDTKYRGKTTASITSSSKAMAKLLKEANRVKQVLSANTETQASVENVFEEIDFRAKVTRADLDRVCSDIWERVTIPIQTVLKSANIVKDRVDSIVVVGGGVRVPAVLNVLKAFIGEAKIAQNVNGDEAAVMGAGFYAAALSTMFRVREIKVRDIQSSQVHLDVGDERVEAFNTSTRLGTKRLFTFRKREDFTFRVSLGTSSPLFDVHVKGLTEASAKNGDQMEDEPKVKIVLELSTSGIVSVAKVNAIYYLQKKAPSLGETILEALGAGKEAEQKDSTGEEKPGNPGDEQTDSTNTTDSETNDPVVDGDQKPEAQANKTKQFVSLNYTISFLGIPPLGENQIAQARTRMESLDRLDRARRLVEETRNALESLVYKGKDWITQSDFLAFVKATDQEALATLLQDTGEWLYEEGDLAALEVVQQRLAKLKESLDPIVFRQQEASKRPLAIEQLNSSITMFKLLVDIHVRSSADPTSKPDSVVEDLQKTVFDIESWLGEKTTAQNELANHETPILTVTDLESRKAQVDSALARFQLHQKRKEAASKKSASAASTSTSTVDTATATAPTPTPSTEGQETSSERDPEDL